MTQQGQELILNCCERILEEIKKNSHYLSSDFIEDITYYVDRIENSVYLDKIKK